MKRAFKKTISQNEPKVVFRCLAPWPESPSALPLLHYKAPSCGSPHFVQLCRCTSKPGFPKRHGTGWIVVTTAELIAKLRPRTNLRFLGAELRCKRKPPLTGLLWSGFWRCLGHTSPSYRWEDWGSGWLHGPYKQLNSKYRAWDRAQV